MRLTQYKLARLERGLLQVELAQKAKIERSRLSMIENGHVLPRTDELQRLAEGLGLNTDALRS